MSSPFEKHPKKTLATVLGFGLLLIFALAELAMRLQGWIPGYTTPNNQRYFQFVNELELYSQFEADEYGITKLHHLVGQYTNRDVANNTETEEFEQAIGLTGEYIDFNNGKWKNAFYAYIQSLKQKPPDDLGESERAYLAYCKAPINSDGFRSIPFEKYADDSTKTSVLLLGDSFTYGLSAENLTSGFAEELAAKGYIVYNTGIPGADPAQYLAIVKRYVPILKPDIVCVNFFMGNDLVFFKREPQPYQPLYYASNAGNLYTCPNGVYLPDAQTAYDYIVSEVSIPKGASLINCLSAKTVISTRLWLIAANYGWVERNHKKFEKYNPPHTNYDWVSEHFLLEIEKICQQNNAQYSLIAIPEITEWHLKIPDDYEGFLTKQSIHVPDNLRQTDYDDSHHFNDSGHKKYANFLDRVFKQTVSD